ncbi:glyoxalase/bleomycin resistance/extradiol dioxygenase family protein [Streptomyces sp. SKN60]|uniref:VOC family protein n=1 Tax=Streptomyces sp. SKN60 TaxID=2855506 RepID=UPI00224629BA|nr:VOC family protein [Streptomyces sp. SKN60]MCX2185544.1 glyoxalase/bleomycin resistance/extradiol dioxygenase family protein [Streptomyces sp. SKN60]
MDALYPRLLVTRFPDCFRFYAAVLPPLTGARLAKGDPAGPYANWDRDDQSVLSLFDRAAMSTALGTAPLPADPAQDTTMLVLRVDDVDQGFALCLQHGGTPVTTPAARPEWGPTLRTAHLRDPEGRLIELQSY